MTATKKNILFVVTSHNVIPKTGGQTGWYLPEVAHPYCFLTNAKNQHVITFVSPKGGESPMDNGSKEAFKEDPVCKEFLVDEAVMTKLKSTKKPEDINPNDFDAIVYPGGHGPMFDLPENEAIQKLCAAIYEKGGVVAAVCHGPCGLVNVKLSNGKYLIDGKKVTGFTNSEEEAVKLCEAMPFLLEDRMTEHGGSFSKAADWAENVVVDGRLVTGQNPASSHALAEQLQKLL
eukprot:Nk52_evm7s265 gene=Nk52_evmTU7s265